MKAIRQNLGRRESFPRGREQTPALMILSRHDSVGLPGGLMALIRYLLLPGFLLLTLSARGAQTDNPIAAFEAANQLYEKGNYTNAAAAYEKLLQAGHVSASVHFNLGNAFCKSGQVGRAIAAYRQAERITPRDPDLRANLQFTRNQTQGPTQSISRWQSWFGELSLNEWTLLAAAGLWLWLLFLAALQWRPTLRPALRGYLITLTLVAAVLCACLGVAWQETRLAPSAIVVTNDLVVHSGPFDEAPKAFVVYDGAEMQVLDQKDDWLQVSADPRRIGWVRRAQVLLLPQG